MITLIPAAEYLVVPDAGHMVAGDDNDIFTARLGDFLERVHLDAEIADAGDRFTLRWPGR